MLYVLFQKKPDAETWEPSGIGLAATPERAIENIEAARAKAGVFAPIELKATPFHETPFEERVTAALDVLLNVVYQSAQAQIEEQMVRNNRGKH